MAYSKANCRILEIAADENATFTERPIPDYPGEIRVHQILSKTSEKHAFIIGGMAKISH